MTLLYDIPYMWNVKRNDTNELTYTTERDSHTQTIDLWCWEEAQGQGQLGSLGETWTQMDS